MLPAEFLLYWKRAFRVVLPVVLAMDMLHSMYYVAGLYQKRLQEWEHEDHIERCVELLPVMQHVLKHCHNRDPLLWPPTVTAALNSAIESTPHLASLAILQPSKGHQGNMTSLACAEVPAGLPISMSIFAHPGPENGDADSELAAQSALGPTIPDSQLGVQPVMESKDPVVSPVTSVWTKMQSLRLPRGQFPILSSFFRSQQQGPDSPQVKVTGAAAQVTDLQISVVCNAKHQTNMASSCSLLDQAQQSMHILADQISHQAKLQGLPWPMMCCTRRSALRWQVDWHGLQWPTKQDSLELQLDRYY